MGNDLVEDIKGRLSIEDVAADYMELKRAGRNLKALSPFSNERTPSFMVSPEKQIWHDFSAGKGGNMFSLVMEMEGVDFRGSLEILAKKAGLNIEDYQTNQNPERASQKSKAYECLELAAKFYQTQFIKHTEALEYILKKRAITKPTALEFKIGYSPNTGHALVDYLTKKKYTEDDMKRAGLVATRYRGAADMFRGRIMIPLMDARGQVIGFTARLLHDDPNAPKYINTPQTMLYDKSRHVFGLHLAKEAIRRNKFVVVVEGNMDVVASHQAGVANVVASAGTAMTEQHLKELLRFTDDIRLSFDQDEAGLRAMERIIPIASKLGVNLSIITVPQGKDPDELIRRNVSAWQETIEDYDYALDWLIKQHKKRHDTNTGQGKRALTDALLPLVSQLTDSVEKDHYLERIAEEINISKDALLSKLAAAKQTHRATHKKRVQVEKVDAQEADRNKAQNQLMALCLVRQELRGYLEPIRSNMLGDSRNQTLLRFLQKTPKFDIKDLKPHLEELREVTDYVKVLVVLYEELYASLELLELQYEAARLQVRVIEQFVKSQKTKLVESMREADDATTDQLLQEVKKLDVLLKTAKEATQRGK
jgi:DNA primase